MKLLAVILAAIVFFAASALPAETRYAEIIIIHEKVTRGPSKSSAELGIARQGEHYQILLETTDWVKIRFNGNDGWVPHNVIKVTYPFAKTSPPDNAGQKAESAAPAAEKQSAAGVEPESLQTRPASTAQLAPDSGRPPGKDSALRADTVAPPAQHSAMSAISRFIRGEPAAPPRRAANFIILPNGSKAIENVDLPETTYVRVIRPMQRILKTLDPASAVVGMAKQGQVFRVINSTESWHHIAYGDSGGWIEKRYTEIVQINEPFLNSRTIILAAVCGAVVIVLVLVIIAVVIIRRRLDRRVSIKKSVLIIAAREKHLTYTMTNTTSSLTRCFEEIGFSVTRETGLIEAQAYLSHARPDVVMVDWDLQAGVWKNVDAILSERSSTSNLLVIFYNFPDLAAPKPEMRISNVQYLGLSFADRDLFAFITPLIITGEQSAVIQTSVKSSALEGEITEGSLSLFFQFIEMGRKTGCLLIRDNTPYGMVYFESGRIIYAACKEQQGQPALLEIFRLTRGQFRFLADKLPNEPNCSISIMEILMELAKTQDEADGHRLR